MTEIHAIVLTMNEERHIRRCLESVRSCCASITVIDSGSTDRTLEIARALGADVVANPWVNYATQMNFGIAHVADRGGWLLRIDADEYLTERSKSLLGPYLQSLASATAGVQVRRQIVFMGRRIRWGGIEPNWQLRLWRNGRGACEQRWMDEHIVVDGRVMSSPIEVVDENLNAIGWWTTKHNQYAAREAIDILSARGELPANDDLSRVSAAPQAKIKRAIKEQVYNRLPGGLRSLAYLFYRYVLRLGFLDGGPGYYFHVLQGFWYRTLVDVKVAEALRLARADGISVAEAVKRTTGIDPLHRMSRPSQSPTIVANEKAAA